METYRIITIITEVISSYKKGYELPIFLEIYILYKEEKEENRHKEK